MVERVYVQKRPGFDGEAASCLAELREVFQQRVKDLRSLRIFNRYDCEGISTEIFETCIPLVFSEPQTDVVFKELPYGDAHFGIELLPGQFDQRADSAAECIQLITQSVRPIIRYAKYYVFDGSLSPDTLADIQSYLINPVDSRLAHDTKPETLTEVFETPQDIEVLDGFCDLSKAELAEFLQTRGLAMDLNDLVFLQDYFKILKRNPTITEIKVVDTYWSDHCRHTTFETHLKNIEFKHLSAKNTFDTYLTIKHQLGRSHKPTTLMDMATCGARWLEHTGHLTTLDKSDEINACTVNQKVMVDGKEQDWLFLFKNETHNHPTEIEPFGGAATCIGGAIRDPLSGRSYVYQAMRVTGSGDPRTPVSDTLPGKLPQGKLTTTAAAGYSSYGNQIGLATGKVSEIYHPGYVAKRMEIGAVVGATPKDHVRREVPQPGDLVVLLGGKTGRDGIGGATGSSKAHTAQSLDTCAAEVQKGNAPQERKLQRLFRRKDACQLIVRCNDFGAGGVSVAIGELADGLNINLDLIPKKYEGLDGTELAISESQERMACVVKPQDIDTFLNYARSENLEATIVATITEDARLTMSWRGQTIVSLEREFLNTNGAPKEQTVIIAEPQKTPHTTFLRTSLKESLFDMVSDLNVCSTKGLSERFDSTIGSSTVLMPYGGTTQLTEADAMVALLPVDTTTTTASAMAWGFNPYLTELDPYRGSYLAVVESISKLVSTGFSRQHSYLTFQEYFERLNNDPIRWGKPCAAVLGALRAQLDLKVAAIGGKDSMSGSFKDMDVPPTLVSFATSIGDVSGVISPEFKQPHSRIYLIAPYRQDELLPEVESLCATLDTVEELITQKSIVSACALSYGAAAQALFKMCLGNRIGCSLEIPYEKLFELRYGGFLVETSEDLSYLIEDDRLETLLVGHTTDAYTIQTPQEVIDLEELQKAWEAPLHEVFPYKREGELVETISFNTEKPFHIAKGIAKPQVIVPVFPGTNCEFDTKRAFERAGAKVICQVINNLTPKDSIESAHTLAQNIKESQILMLPGGFSAGDEPDGSAKFITAFFRNPELRDAVNRLLHSQDGLILGICNGFQALIKIGLVPFGEIREMDDTCPTLTYNEIGRHQSGLIRMRVASTLSPWMSKCEVGDIHTVAISHGEGRFVATPEMLEILKEQGQICTQYCDISGQPSMSWDVNPNGSVLAIEGICSPDGRILGKMGHSERSGYGLYKNVEGNKHQPIIEGGIAYFTE